MVGRSAAERSGHGCLTVARPGFAMSGLMHSVAANLMFIVVFFAAAVLLTLGMLGFH